jgi:hypothetical protein
MSDNVSKIVGAYLKLNSMEKRNVVEVIAKLQAAHSVITERQIIKSFGLESMESSTTINFAPLPGGCPACGRL